MSFEDESDKDYLYFEENYYEDETEDYSGYDEESDFIPLRYEEEE